MDGTSEREAAIFYEALRLSVQERAAYLDQACAGDAPLRRQIEELLQADASAGTFLAELANGAEGPIGAGAGVGPEGTVRIEPGGSERPGDTIGRYKLMEKVGEGGCGVVYVAEQTEPVRRRVALKVIKLGMDTQQVVARFEAERQALAMMDHPNIAKVLDAGSTAQGRPYFVMELVRGIRITDYCDQANLSTRERLELFIKVCQAIQHAHQKGIIHRDIKPSNLLVTLHDGVPVPKVIDFGIAKATEGRLTDQTVYTQLHQFIGTPAYMSPEQAEMSGLDIDTRSDIYSLGVLLYELLVGSTPFDAGELMAAGLDRMRQTIREQEPARPSTRLATLPGEELTTTAKRRSVEASRLAHLLRGDLDWIVMKCLEKDRTRRYETANGLAADLKRHLNNEPVVARPPSTAYRFQKAIRRNKLAFTAAGAVAGALILGVAVSTWEMVRARRAQRETEVARKGEQQQRLQAQSALQVAETEKQRADAQAQKARESQRQAERSLYAANLNLAQQAWEQNNPGEVREILETTAAYPQLGFEWNYWQRQTHLERKTFYGHTGLIFAVAISRDGERIVTGSDDGTAKVWDAATGKELLTLKGVSGYVLSVAFSPDGKRIVTGGGDPAAKVWDAITGKELLTLKGHRAQVMFVAYSPNGERIATASDDQTAKLWDAASGKELTTFEGHATGVHCVAFSPDGARIVSGSRDKTARIWDAASGRELITLSGHADTIRSAVFSPDGARIATGSWDGTAKVWRASDGKELVTFKGHSAGVQSVRFSPDGRRIVSGSSDRTAKVWDAASGNELRTLKGHGGSVLSVAFSEDNRWIVTGSRETAKIWEASGSEESRVLEGHSAQVMSVAFSPDGQRIATGSYDQTARLWEAASGKELFTLKGHSDAIWGVAFAGDGQQMVTGSADQTAKIWDVASGKELFTLKGHSAAVASARFSPDAQRIVTGSFDQTARLWETASGNYLGTFKGHNGLIWSVAFSPDSRRIVTGSDDQTAKVWEAASGRELFTLRGHNAAVRSAAFSTDGHRIVTGSDDQTARVWDAANGRELLSLQGGGAEVLSVAISPDGQRIVAGGGNRTASVWEAATARQVAAWQSEEETAAKRLAAVRQELAKQEERGRALRAQDPGAIRQWLVLAPIPFEGRSGKEALAQEQIPQEPFLRARAGERVKVGPRERVWSVVQLGDFQIDFNQLLGVQTEWSVAYAVCYLHSVSNQTGLLVKVGSDDEAKIYLNGKEIYRCEEVRGWVLDQDVVAGVDLKAGLNVLVFKVVNEISGWRGSVRFTDAVGQPIKGIQVTLDPDTNNDGPH